MEDERIPKDVLYGEFASDTRRISTPALQFLDSCKRDIKSAQISIESWESAAADSYNFCFLLRNLSIKCHIKDCYLN